MSDDSRQNDDTLMRRVRRAVRDYDGPDRREPPMIGEGVKWLLGVAAPLIAAIITMYSAVQVNTAAIADIRTSIAELKQIDAAQWNRINEAMKR